MKQFLSKRDGFDGPVVLWQSELPTTYSAKDLEPDDPEVKSSFAVSVVKKSNVLLSRIERFSDWYKAKRAIANCRRYVRILKAKITKTNVATVSDQ